MFNSYVGLPEGGSKIITTEGPQRIYKWWMEDMEEGWWISCYAFSIRTYHVETLLECWSYWESWATTAVNPKHCIMVQLPTGHLRIFEIPSGFIQHGALEAMDNDEITDFPMRTSIHKGFSIAMWLCGWLPEGIHSTANSESSRCWGTNLAWGSTKKHPPANVWNVPEALAWAEKIHGLNYPVVGKEPRS